MNSELHINSRWKTHLIRGVAIFFLLFVGIEQGLPQYCDEEADSFPTVTVISACNQNSGCKSIDGPETSFSSDNSQRDKSPSQLAQEDCLGGCAHLLVSKNTVIAAGADLKLSLPPLKNILLPSSPPTSIFNPPRSC